MEHDDHELAVIESEDDPVVADAETVAGASAFQLPYVTVTCVRKAIDGAADSTSDRLG